ncbi:hypothetical protein N8H74_09275 [Pseudomonas sp. B2M1-30]|uniref:hypothetical protein n=1 Tax=Pseudomonas TaxID=286 RepID=UPI001C3DBDA9|nr:MULTISPECIES: hypothetical protein [Pseudomonas]MBV4476609.1 hypothetical protein [Pseudomonas botevensis]MCU0118443.1 hypothetical protein [Pseudomonas sp. B2M1-30]MCU7259519.1 hypothetical protein [Pseudomonas koreensis]
MALPRKNAHYRGIADALENTVAPKIDRIAQLLNCPEKGEEMRRAITETRKEFLLNQPEEDVVDEDDVFEEVEDEDDEYDEFDWTTE